MTIRKLLPFLLLAVLIFSSCAPQPPATEEVDVNALMTQSVGTFVAQYFQTQTAMYTPPTPTPLDTPTPIPTNTQLAALPTISSATAIVFSTSAIFPTATPTGTFYTSTPNPSTLAYGCNNLGLINDLEPAAGTRFSPGQTFTKTWQVANTGTCDWVFNYRLVFVSGNSMGGESVRLGKQIEPEKWTRLSVSLIAPDDPGTYSGYWQLSDAGGHTFGVSLPVSIEVRRAATATPTSSSSYP